MPRNATITLPAKEWVELTNADVTAIRVQNLTGNPVRLVATGTSEPSDDTGHIRLNGGEIIAANGTIAALWPGESTATRIWAICDFHGRVSVSHA